MSDPNSLAYTTKTLEELEVPASAYSIGTPREGAVCLLRTSDGTYEIFRLVGGAAHYRTLATTEQGACDVLLGELGWARLLPDLGA